MLTPQAALKRGRIYLFPICLFKSPKKKDEVVCNISFRMKPNSESICYLSRKHLSKEWFLIVFLSAEAAADGKLLSFLMWLLMVVHHWWEKKEKNKSICGWRDILFFLWGFSITAVQEILVWILNNKKQKKVYFVRKWKAEQTGDSFSVYFKAKEELLWLLLLPDFIFKLRSAFKKLIYLVSVGLHLTWNSAVQLFNKTYTFIWHKPGVSSSYLTPFCPF